MSALRLGPGDRLRLEPLIADPPVLAGTGTFVSKLGLVQDLDGDGIPDLLLPAGDGLAVYLGTAAGFAAQPVVRLPVPGEDYVSGERLRHAYPLPQVEDVDGDGRPDLVLRDPDHEWERVWVLRNAGGGHFLPAVEVQLGKSVVHLPGRLVAAAVARATRGRLGFVLLVDDELREPTTGGGSKGSPAHPRGAAAAPSPGRPRTVFFVEPGKPELELVADEVPAKIDSLAALSLPDGNQAADLLVLGEPGALYLLDPPWGGAHPRCRQVLAAPGLDLRSVHLDKEGSPRPRLPWLPVARAGRLQLLAARQPTAGELTAIATYPLPVSASREAWGLELTSRPVHLLPGAPGAPPRFAVGPEAQGAGARLRTLLLSSAPGEPPVEAWSLFPGAEKAGEGVYSSWDGKPALLLRSFAKLGIFTKRDLRLYLLSRDRSRAGAPPVIAVHTDCALWHELGAYLADAGGNGRQDLVLIHPEGLRGKKLRFQVYPSLGQGRLAVQPRVSSLDVEADDWFYGADLSGDGIPDLLVKSQGRLLLYPGAGKSYRLAERPSWSFSLSAPPGGGAAARKKTAADKKTAAGKQRDGTRTEVQVQAGGERRAARVVTARGRGFGDLVDLHGDGRPILFLATVDDDGGSQITLVGR